MIYIFILTALLIAYGFYPLKFITEFSRQKMTKAFTLLHDIPLEKHLISFSESLW